MVGRTDAAYIKTMGATFGKYMGIAATVFDIHSDKLNNLGQMLLPHLWAGRR